MNTFLNAVNIYIYICPDTAKHQSKPQGYIRYSTAVRYSTCHRNRLQENNAYLLQSADKKVGEASDINKGFVFHDIYWLYPGDYISDIALVPGYNLYIYTTTKFQSYAFGMNGMNDNMKSV